MRIGNENLLDASGAVSLASNQTLKPVYLGHILNYSIQLVFTGSPTGTFKLQASNDPGRPSGASDTEVQIGLSNWTDIADSTQAISAAGDHTWTVENAGYSWVRVVYTFASGSGSLTSARCVVKGL